MQHLAEAGLESTYQPIDDEQGNAIGRLRGSGEGPDLLLYAPTDTAFSGDPEEELPWLGSSVRADLAPHGVLQDDYVIGLGAENPKAYVTCVVAAALAVKRAGIPLRGSLLVGLGAGGMPTNRRPGVNRANAGQGNGCSFMLEQGARGDFAILAKPGYAVSWEEVGLCWFKVRELGQALAEIQAAHPGLEVEHEMILSIPGTRTDPRNWIVQSLMRAWEHREGQPHTPITGTSGATDAAILRGRGIPTARLGLPRTPPHPAYPGFSMGAATPAAMQRLTECLIYSIVDTCTRDRAAVGLAA